MVVACVTAHAAPAAVAEDEIALLLAEKGLLTRLEQVSHTVSDRASNLVITAMGFLGVPYRRGGNSVETGFDCSGFVRAMYEQTVGLLLPRRAKEQAAATEAIDKKDLQPGDLVFFNTMKRAFSHVGIYVGEGKFIHSPRPGAEVRVEDMGGNYWQRRFNGARRVLALSTTEPPQNRP
ncbi:MAG TPA: C40 family peptidase [Ramlibacter sp.]|nr:C40 family peptidase [Ramlibacter sp.]